MSKNIKVQLYKTIQMSKLETLINSYNSLKSILSPNLPETNISFISYLIDLIISQLKFFLDLLGLNEEKKIYEKLNFNNQNLSKQIAALYEFPRYQLNSKLSLNSTSERDRNENIKSYNNKESYSLEDKKENINIQNTDNLEFNYNNNTESKMMENDELLEPKNKDEIQNIFYFNNKNLKISEGNEKLIMESELEKDKNEIVKNLNFNNNKNDKEKIKNIQVKTQNKFIKKLKPKNKTTLKDNKIINNKNLLSPKSQSKKYLNPFKLNKNEYPSFNIETKLKNHFFKKGFQDFKEKIKEKSEKKNKIKTNENKKGLLQSFKININKNSEKQNKEDNDKISEKRIDNQVEANNNDKYERKKNKSKTVIFRSIQLPYLIGIETSENDIYPKDNYISITFSNRILDSFKTPDNRNHKNKLVKLKNIDQRNLKTEFNEEKKLNLNYDEDYFSLDQFLISKTGKKGEKTFLTKKGKVLINQKQKDILEDYINNYLFEEEDAKSSPVKNKRGSFHSKGVKEKLKGIKDKKNKNYVIKGTSMHYNLNDVTELLQILPESFKVPLDDFYFRKKKASMFDRGIFKICHKVIDNYKILEGKEDIFQFKKSKSKPKYNIQHQKRELSNKNIKTYQNRNERLNYKNMYSN